MKREYEYRKNHLEEDMLPELEAEVKVIVEEINIRFEEIVYEVAQEIIDYGFDLNEVVKEIVENYKVVKNEKAR